MDAIPVVVLDDSSNLTNIQRDAFFVQAALGWIDGEPLAERGVHVPTIVDEPRLERMDFDSERTIVIPGLTSLDEGLITRLHEFVSAGGGLWIGLGPRTDVDAFNQFFHAEGNGLAPLAIDRIVEENVAPLPGDSTASDTKRRTTIDQPTRDHPALFQLADSEQLDLSEVVVTQRFRFVPPREGRSVSTLLQLSNGQPLAVENYVGKGRVIVQAIPMRLQWSDLARSESFVVMVQDWLAYLTQPLATRHNLSPGDPLSVVLDDSSAREATLRTPHGDEIELTADAAGDSILFRSSRTILPGDYSLEYGISGDAIPFHVHREADESDLTPLATADRALLADVTSVKGGTDAETAASYGRSDPLWPVLLIVVIGLIAAELLLAGMISRERFGSAPISETTEATRSMMSNPATAAVPAWLQKTGVPSPELQTPESEEARV